MALRTTPTTERPPRCPAWRRSRTRREEAPPVRAETTGVTIPYPNSQPLPAIATVTPPSGAARPRLTFLGTGYLGATYAICFAELGYEVLGFDVDADKIAKLAAGEVPFHEPGLDELLRRNLAAGRLRFSTDYRGDRRLRRRALHLRRHPAARRRHGRRPVVRRGGGHQPGPAPDPQGADRRQVHRAGGHRRVGRAARRQARPGRARRRGGLEPGVPPGGLRRRGRAAPQPDRGRRQERVGQRHALRRAQGRLRPGRHRGPRGAAGGHRLRHRRAGQGRRQRLPRHQDLLHQRDGRGLRGRRRRRHPARPRASATTRGSATGSSRPGSASAAAACPRTSAPSRPARRSWAPARRCASCTRST